MKDVSYYGIGNDEYSRFRTLDNGKTWVANGVAVGEGKQVYDRIIYGSTNNGGLTYSDDGGNTIMQSDRETGNWGNIVYVKNEEEQQQEHNQFIVYASSLDDDTLVYSIDLGEHWIDIPGAAGTEAQVIDNVVYIYGNGTVTKIEGTIPTVVATNATVIDGVVKAEPLEENPKVEGVLSIVLNKLFLPIFSKRFAGMTFDKLCKLTPDMTLGNVNYQKIIYNNTGAAEADEIDYEYYCNMRPMTYSLSDIISTSVGENAQLVLYASIDDELINNPTLKKMFNYIDDIMMSYREIAKVIFVKRIMGIEVDVSSIQDIDQEKEEYVNAVKYANMMVNVQQGAVASIMGTIINKTFALDNARRLSILKAAIFECISAQAGSIAYRLNEIKRAVNQEYFYVNESDFSAVNFTFGDALDIAITKYVEAIFKIVKFDNPDDNSKQYELYTAAEAYKDNRSYLLDYIIKETDANIKNKEVKYDIVNGYLEDLSDFKAKIDEIYNNYVSTKKMVIAKSYLILNGNQEESIEEYKENYPYIYNMCKGAAAEQLEAYNDIGLDASDKSSIKQKFLECYNSYDFKYKQNTIIDDLAGSVKREVILPTLTDAINGLEGAAAVSEYIYLSESDFPADDENYSVKNIIDNYGKIINKFKQRCYELLDYIADNFAKNSNTDITVDDYYNSELISRENNKILTWLNAEEYVKDADIDAITPYLKTRGEVLKNILWNSYKESKEVI